MCEKRRVGLESLCLGRPWAELTAVVRSEPPRSEHVMQDDLMPRYAELIYNGFWFSPEREALQTLIDKTQEFCTGKPGVGNAVLPSARVAVGCCRWCLSAVSCRALPYFWAAFCAGTVRLKLYKGNVSITGRKSPYSLYDKMIASFEDDEGLYNQADAGECLPPTSHSLDGGRLNVCFITRRLHQASGAATEDDGDCQAGQEVGESDRGCG